MIQRQHLTAYPCQGASGLIAQLGRVMRLLAEFPHMEISNNGGLPYGMPPFAEADPQGTAGGVKLVGRAVQWRDRVRFGRMLASWGVRLSHLPVRELGFAE
jgi:hypothetical protein